MFDRKVGGRLLAEFVIIVLGVLAALAVDEWRDSRVEREMEVELLSAFLRDLQTDSADFHALPERAEDRIVGAEVVLREFRSEAGPEDPLHALLDSMEADGRLPPGPASDEDLEDSVRGQTVTSDLDVASGAYRDFADGGAYRLLRNRDLRTRIHEYYYRVDQNLEYNQIVGDAVLETTRRGHDLGIAPGMPGAEIRRRLTSAPTDARAAYLASLHSLQRRSSSQRRIAGAYLAAEVTSILAQVRAERDRLAGS